MRARKPLDRRGALVFVYSAARPELVRRAFYVVAGIYFTCSTVPWIIALMLCAQGV